MPTTLGSTAVCAICGEPLNQRRECLACLVRGGLEPSDETAEDPGSLVFGDFEIERREDGTLWELGHGAMGVTYRAFDQVLRRTVALKVVRLPADETLARGARERFLWEARSAAALRHPNVAGAFQFGAQPESDRAFYAMELVEGETLEALVRRNGPVSPAAAVTIALQVARAMVAAAGQGLIHRDLKPANIMLASSDDETSTPVVKVIDFGLAKSIAPAAGMSDSSHGGFFGTPTFASPEQLAGAPVDARSDIYSLGATLWYVLTGELPYPGKTIAEIRARRAATGLPVKELVDRRTPAPLIRLLSRTLAAGAEERPQSARELLTALEACQTALTTSPRAGRRRAWSVAAALVALVALGLTTYFWTRQSSPPSLPAEKSIAVLPFENLSTDETNRLFAVGIQDDVLTSLAQIHELKVISRTSVMAYQDSGSRNIREIGRALGVENILEGSVRREGNRVLLNVQLIDAIHDRHIWARRYDRTAADSIGLQGELATQIAVALETELAPEVKARLANKPTDNPEAYALYLRGLGEERTVNPSNASWKRAEQLYEDAIALDPKFGLAYARLSIVQSGLTLPRQDEMPKARRTAEEALHLAPALGEAHMALGLCLYWADKNYSAALKEFSVAEATLPNEPEILHYIAGIERRQGRWKDSLATYGRACRIDPRNRKILFFAAYDHLLVRDWPVASDLFHRVLEIAPDSSRAWIGLAYLEVYRRGDPAAGRALLRHIPPQVDPDGEVTGASLDLAMLQRDFPAAEKIVADCKGRDFPAPDKGFPKEFYLAQIARARGDRESADRYFASIATEVESWKEEALKDPDYDRYVGIYNTYRGRKEEALAADQRGIAAEPESRDAFHGAGRLGDLALTYALNGEREKAIVLLQRLLKTPGPVECNNPHSITQAELRLRWEWDSLRSDPRFQALLAPPEPSTALTSVAALRDPPNRLTIMSPGLASPLSR